MFINIWQSSPSFSSTRSIVTVSRHFMLQSNLLSTFPIISQSSSMYSRTSGTPCQPSNSIYCFFISVPHFSYLFILVKHAEQTASRHFFHQRPLRLIKNCFQSADKLVNFSMLFFISMSLLFIRFKTLPTKQRLFQSVITWQQFWTSCLWVVSSLNIVMVHWQWTEIAWRRKSGGKGKKEKAFVHETIWDCEQSVGMWSKN
jgi:hypothetical protein